MLDYLEIRSDNRYSKKISVTEFNEILSDISICHKIGNCSYTLQDGNAIYQIQGLLSDERGCYAIESDYDFSQINLVVIEFPFEKEGDFSGMILEITSKISKALSWDIYDPDEEVVI